MTFSTSSIRVLYKMCQKLCGNPCTWHLLWDVGRILGENCWMLWTCKSRSPPWWKSWSPANTKINFLICYLLPLYHWRFHTSATGANWSSSLLSKGFSKKSLVLVTVASWQHFCVVKCWTTPCRRPLCTASALRSGRGCLSSPLKLCLVWSPDPLTLCLMPCAVHRIIES